MPRGLRSTASALLDSGRLFVVGALVAGFAIGMRSQSAWLTTPLIRLVLVDRVGRDVAGALLGGADDLRHRCGPVGRALDGADGRPRRVSRGDLRTGRAKTSRAWISSRPTSRRRRLAIALMHTFAYPWVTTPLAVVALATAVRAGWPSPGATAARAAAGRGRRPLPAVPPRIPGVVHDALRVCPSSRSSRGWWCAGFSVFGGLAAAVGTAGVLSRPVSPSACRRPRHTREPSPLFRALADVTEPGPGVDGAGRGAPARHAPRRGARSARIDPIAAGALPSPSGREWTRSWTTG